VRASGLVALGFRCALVGEDVDGGELFGGDMILSARGAAIFMNGDLALFSLISTSNVSAMVALYVTANARPRTTISPTFLDDTAFRNSRPWPSFLTKSVEWLVCLAVSAYILTSCA
jgi:hypothetical protein